MFHYIGQCLDVTPLTGSELSLTTANIDGDCWWSAVISHKILNDDDMKKHLEPGYNIPDHWTQPKNTKISLGPWVVNV